LGLQAIAEEIGQPERTVYHALEKGKLPAGKLPGKGKSQTWVASRQALRVFFQQLTAPRTDHQNAKAVSE
jgi:hypothetical protein